MKTSEKRVAVIEILTSILLLLYIFVTNKIGYYKLILILIGIILITLFLIGYEKKRELYTKDALLSILIFCFIYYIITYLSGLFIGFLKSGYNLKLIGIFKNTFPLILIIFIEELLRYQLIQKGGKNKLVYILNIFMFLILDLAAVSYQYNLTTSVGIIKMIYMSLLPLLAKNIMLTFISYRFSYIPAITYRLLMEVLVFILPIVPNIDAYISTILNLIFPSFILYKMYMEFNKKKRKNPTRIGKMQYASTAIIIILLLIMISLTSGLFKYYSLAVGSGSMEPNINKGDLVIVNKLKQNELESLKVGEVLVYKHNDIVIVHRIVDISEYNGKHYYKTKGDNNAEEDGWLTEESLVIGKAILRIPYFGIPTVWLNERV